MDNTLNYQQARRIRERSIKDVIADELIRGKGVGSALTGAIGLKTQARMKGIKEKFDPLNIVKFMTMGSRFGPALFGKLTGRNQKDIDYFTGRTKSVVGSRNTAEKINKLSGEGDSEGLNEQLAKIYSFLKNSREEDIKLNDENNNSDDNITIDSNDYVKPLGKNTINEHTEDVLDIIADDVHYYGFPLFNLIMRCVYILQSKIYSTTTIAYNGICKANSIESR